MANKIPEDWWTYHHQECGTKYRGCSPECPKEIYELTGEWTGQQIMADRLRDLEEEVRKLREYMGDSPLGEIRIIIQPHSISAEVRHKGDKIYGREVFNDGNGGCMGVSPLSKKQARLTKIADTALESLKSFLKPYKPKGSGSTGYWNP